MIPHPPARMSGDPWLMVPMDRHPVAVYLSKLSPGSRRTMRAALETCARVLTGDSARRCDWTAVRYQHLVALRTALAERYAPATANKMLAAVKGTVRETWRLGYMSAEDFHRAIDLEAVPGTRLRRGRALTEGEVRALFHVCASDRHPESGIRDACAIALLYGAGLRRSELADVNLEDYRDGKLLVRGKGNRERRQRLPEGARRAVARYLEMRGLSPGPLVLSLSTDGRLTAQGVYHLVSRRRRQARVRGFSPHDLRRTYVTRLLEAGCDLATVRSLAGHQRLETTAGYDERDEHERDRAVELLHVPYEDRFDVLVVGLTP